MDKYLRWGKTSLLAQQNKIDYVIFEAPDGDRYGKVIGYRENDTLIVLTIPIEGGDERTYLVESKNYHMFHKNNYFNCDARVTPIVYDYDGTWQNDGDSTETRIWFELFKEESTGFWTVIFWVIVFWYFFM